ncbi:hypothetical protein D3C81_2339800 [compost metagenome]
MQAEHAAVTGFLDVGALHAPLGILQVAERLLLIATAGGHLGKAGQCMQQR